LNKTFDLWLFLSIVGLSVFGLFNLLGINNALLLRQLIFFLIGFAFLFLVNKLGLVFFRANSRFFYFFGLTLLLLTFFLGQEIRGAKRWLDFYFFKFQASELLKPFFIIYLADIFSQEKSHDAGLNKFITSLLFFLITFLAIFKQPDLGNSIIYGAIYFSILFFLGLPLRYFIYFFLGLFILAPGFWRVLTDYQKQRLLSFINTQVDPQGVSYNLIQSIITVGSGGFFGRGLGLGTQSRFSFLPENHTDFVFASLVEQFGFVGATIVILFYGVIFFQLIKKIFTYQKETFIFLFLIGTTAFLIWQIFINIAMNLGLLPITGVPLPFVSYGGASIISTMIVLGLTLAL